jgi:hypothetical protein
MAAIFTIIGIALIVAAIQDIFFTLFHPAHAGDICDWIAGAIWRAFRQWWPSALSLAGPLAFVSIVLYWCVSICFGFALIYLPHLPAAFTFASGLNPQQYGNFLGALDVSIGGLITLSTGAYSTSNWLQLLMGVESVLGFCLLTASISWILSIYPVLEHRKSLAHEATLLHFSEVSGVTRLEQVSDSDLLEILLGLAGQLVTSRNELVQFPITYYFHETETSTSLAGILPYLAETAQWAAERKGAAGIAGTTLGGAIDDFLRMVAEMFLHRKFTNRAEILQAFAHEHLREAVHSPLRRPRAA